jgi:hypothetical protein
MAVSGRRENAPFLVCLIVFDGAGTAVLQAAFQQGGALTTALCDRERYVRVEEKIRPGFAALLRGQGVARNPYG